MAGYGEYRNIQRPEYEKLKADFPKKLEKDAVADDWAYYRFYEGAVNTGYYEDKFAVSATLGGNRYCTVGEYYNVFGW